MTSRRMLSSVSLVRAAALGVVAALVAGTAHSQTEDLLYTAIDVGPWGNPRFSGEAHVNEAGHVASKGVTQAYRWVNGVSQDLGLLTDGTFSDPRGLNDRGQVAGTGSIDNNTFDTRAFLWRDGAMQSLGSLSSDQPSEGHAINQLGQVAGWSNVEFASGFPVHAFRSLPAGGLEDLGTLPVAPENAGNAWSFAWGINDAGAVVGESDTASGERHAFLWQDGVMQDLGTLEGGTFSSARDVNNLGQVVGFSTTANGETHAFLWQNGVMEDLGLLGGIESVAEAINDVGQVVGYTQTANGRFHAFIYERGVMKDLNNLFDNTAFPAWAELVRATDINNRGDIVGYGDKGGRRTFLLRKLCRDTDGNGNPDDDGDALCDNWETEGIDADGDGLVDLRLYDMNGDGNVSAAEQADPDHKDVYVEIDWMALHQPEPVALARVIAAFAAAPVANPDGNPGIRLHLLADERAADHFDELAFADDPAGPAIPHFDEIKGERFGTALERGSMSPEKRLAAKRLAFRYALFVHKRSGTGSSGRAELPGNDFVISLGDFAEMLGHRTGNLDQQAGTFMHEFGHTLNLRHGGVDDVNCKPNYLSIMSYSRQFDGVPVVGRPLDYSRAQLATLVETALAEALGIGGPAGSMTAIGPPPRSVVPGDAPIDWSRDGDDTDLGVSTDANRMSRSCNGFGDVLVGQDDWTQVFYDFRASPDFADGLHSTVTGQDEEIDLDEAVELSPDADSDGIVNVLDNCPVILNAGQGDADQDSVGDACDNCTAVANADQRDTNGDGYGNLCDGDLDGNGAVNAGDLARFRLAFGSDSPDADFNGSGGIVNAADLAIFRTLFGKPPGPSGLHP